MKTSPECIPCILEQVLTLSRRESDDEWLHRKVLNEVMSFLPSANFENSPAEINYECLKISRKVLGLKDSHKEEKKKENTTIMDMAGKLSSMIENSDNGLYTATKLAIAGSTPDLWLLPPFKKTKMINSFLSKKLAIDEYDKLGAELEKTKKILYLLNTAGEIVFDKFVIERLKDKEVTAVVRETPFGNIATKKDVDEIGLDKICNVVYTGCDVLGVPLNQCSSEFKKIFNESDLIIAKGQNNFSTLEGIDKNIFFLFVSKCDYVANYVDAKIRTGILMKNNTAA